MSSAAREQARRMAARGVSASEIRQRTGLSGAGARNVVSNWSPAGQARHQAAAAAAAPSQAAPSSSGGSSSGGAIRSVGQGLRTLGSGGISREDLRNIMQATDSSGAQIIKKLDALNQNLRQKDKTGISLNAGAANMLIKRATKRPSRGFSFAPIDFGQGRIGQTLQGMLGTPGSPGTFIKGERVGARDAVEPTLLAGGMQIRPGGRPRVIGFGKQYGGPTDVQPEEVVVDQQPVDTGIDMGGGFPMIPPPEINTSVSSGAGGADLSSWATGFRRAKSSRQRAGRMAQGLASQKKSPFTSWNQ